MNKAKIFTREPTIKATKMMTDIKILNCRERKPERELYGAFKFKPSTQTERIADTVANNLRLKLPQKKVRRLNFNQTYDDSRPGSVEQANSSTSPRGGQSVYQNTIVSDQRSPKRSSVMRTSHSNKDFTQSRMKSLKNRHQSVPFNKSRYQHTLDLQK